MAKTKAERASFEKTLVSIADPSSVIKASVGEISIEMGRGLDAGLKLLIIQALEAKKTPFTVDIQSPEAELVESKPVETEVRFVPEAFLETMLAGFGITVEVDQKSELVWHFNDPVTDVGYTFDLVTRHWFSSDSTREVGISSLIKKLSESRPDTEKISKKPFIPKFGPVELPPAPKR
jgi:hypothetical protein